MINRRAGGGDLVMLTLSYYGQRGHLESPNERGREDGEKREVVEREKEGGGGRGERVITSVLMLKLHRCSCCSSVTPLVSLSRNFLHLQTEVLISLLFKHRELGWIFMVLHCTE